MDREAVKSRLTDADFSMSQSEALSHIFAEMATKSEVHALRSDMKAEFKAVRGEMASEFKAVRREMASEFKAVRGEMASEFKAVRGEMQIVKAELIAAIERSAKETQARLFSTMVGMIIALAAIFTLLDIFID